MASPSTPCLDAVRAWLVAVVCGADYRPTPIRSCRGSDDRAVGRRPHQNRCRPSPFLRGAAG